MTHNAEIDAHVHGPGCPPAHWTTRLMVGLHALLGARTVDVWCDCTRVIPPGGDVRAASRRTAARLNEEPYEPEDQ